MSPRHRLAAVAMTATACLWPAAYAWGSDHTNLEEGLPVEIADAYPIPYLGREVQGRLAYRVTPDAEHQVSVEPRFELGFPRNAQISVKVPLIAALSTRADDDFYLGRVGLEAMYNVNQETLSLPAFALAAGVEAPDTRDGGNFDPFGRLFITKTIPNTMRWQRLHLNGLLQGNVGREPRERALRYLVAVGYDLRLSATFVGVVDVFREQPIEDSSPSNIGEVGFRVQVTPLVTLALGGGAGVSDSGRVVARAAAAFQWFAF